MRYGIANTTGRPPYSEVRSILEAARRNGLEALDAARAYGESEDVIGELTETDPYWTITTKLTPDILRPGEDLAAALFRMETSIATSLRALHRERLDVLLLHRALHRDAFEGALWDELCARRAAGEITQLGVSVANPGEAWNLLDDPSVDVLQVASSLLDQRLAREGFFEQARKRKLQIVVRSVFLQGVAHLEIDALPPHLRPLAQPLRRFAPAPATLGAAASTSRRLGEVSLAATQRRVPPLRARHARRDTRARMREPRSAARQQHRMA